MNAKRLSQVIILTLIFGPAGASAQAGASIHLAGGPAYRSREVHALTSGQAVLDGVAINLSLARLLVGRVNIVLGVGGYWGESASAQIIVEPCLPPGPCTPPDPNLSQKLSGRLFHARIGLGISSDRVSGSMGLAGGYVGDALDPAGAGVYAETRILPFGSRRGLTLGLMGLVLDPAPGGTRALLMPSIGWQF